MNEIHFDISDLEPVGTKFIMRGKTKREHTIVGYHVEFDTDTNETKLSYRTSHEFCGQTITSVESIVTVRRSMWDMYGRTTSVAN